MILSYIIGSKLLLFSLILLQYEGSAQTLCAKGDKPCGSECFSPQSQECINEISIKPCLIGQSLCSSKCYDSIFQECVVHNESNSTLPCYKGFNLCQKECFNSTTHTCFKYNGTSGTGDSYKVCSLEQELCHNTCFSPNTHVCHTGGAGSSSYTILCTKGKSVCETLHKTCYDPEYFECLAGEPGTRYSQVCPKGQSLCTYPNNQSPICYDPSIDTCHSNDKGAKLCAKDEDICGWACFNSTTQICYPGNKLCLSDEGLCLDAFDGNCYSKNTEQCLTSENGNIEICKVGEDICGLNCYNPEYYDCITMNSSSSVSATLCSKGQQVCGLPGSFDRQVCFNPEIENCFTSQRYLKVCPKGQEICGNSTLKCYDPTSQICMLNDYFNQELCSIEESICGSKCYNPSTHKCYKYGEGPDQKRICQLIENLCGDYYCYNPEHDQCIILPTNRTLVCSKSQSLCMYTNSQSGLCYNPAKETCIQLEWDSAVCLIGQDVCPVIGGTCYSPEEQVCLKPETSSYYELCPIGHHMCGSRCYSPEAQVCIQSDEGRPQLCPIGQKLCGYSSCYSPEVQVCHSTRLCHIGEQLCGSTCYSPLVYSCFSNDFVTDRLCPIGNMICGPKCYFPGTHACHQDY